MTTKNSSHMRIYTFNIHHRTNFKKLSKFIKSLEPPDILCLQEVPSRDLDEKGDELPLQFLANETGLTYFKFAIENSERPFANAILSKYPIISEKNIPLTGKDLGYPAHCVSIELSIPSSVSENLNYWIHTIHLDYRTEDVRILQLEELFLYLENEKLLNKPHLLLGDFNSLERSDYSEKEWEEIIKMRNENNWEEPKCLVLDEIKKRGYIDCNKEYFPKGFPKDEIATCWAGTRIDYIFKSQNFKGNLINCKSIKNEISDHSAILAEFDF